MLEYDLLRIIWWLLLGVLLTGFALTDGFDFGVAMLLPFITKNDVEKRLLINSIGPVWESNQVWFVLGGGAIFAAWPMVYAVAFSGFYLAMLVVLSALIFRPVAFKFRSKINGVWWRRTWDTFLFLGGLVPVLIFGMALGNVVQGVPFHFDAAMRNYYSGTFLELFNPFALLAGLTSIMMTLTHGSLYIAIKVESPMSERAICVARGAALITGILFAIGLYWLIYVMPAYQVTSTILANQLSIPLDKTVAMVSGGWGYNFQRYPWFSLAPLSVFAGVTATWVLARRHLVTAFIASGVTIAGIVVNTGLSIYPFLLPSSSFPSHSLLIWDASSSQLTLFLMLLATATLMPIILFYVSWVYRVLRGKVTEQSIRKNSQSY